MSEPRRRSSGTMRSTNGLARCPLCDPPMSEERGSGKCGHCHGVGTVPLGVVPGRVPCPKCKGKTTCHECLGVGNITLDRAGELFGLEPITRRDTPSAIAAIDLHTTPKEMPAADTDPCPPPSRKDHRREPEDD